MPEYRSTRATDREQCWVAALRAARRGDRRAYGRWLGEVALVQRARASRGLGRYGLGSAEVDDVVQETLLAVHLSLPRWDETRPVVPWVMAIGSHKLLDAMRRLGRRRRLMRPLDHDHEGVSLAHETDTLSALEIVSALQCLTRREQEVVTGLACAQQSVATVAERLRLSPVSVRVAFHRGLRRLREIEAARQGEAEVVCGSSASCRGAVPRAQRPLSSVFALAEECALSEQ